MEDILKLINKREYYVFLILSKIYIETKGQMHELLYESEIKKPMQELLGEDFDKEYFSIGIHYCFEEGYIKGISHYSLTVNGRRYFEDLLISVQNAPDEEKELLKEKLPDKVIKYLDITDKVINIGAFLARLANGNPFA